MRGAPLQIDYEPLLLRYELQLLGSLSLLLDSLPLLLFGQPLLLGREFGQRGDGVFESQNSLFFGHGEVSFLFQTSCLTSASVRTPCALLAWS